MSIGRFLFVFCALEPVDVNSDGLDLPIPSSSSVIVFDSSLNFFSVETQKIQQYLYRLQMNKPQPQINQVQAINLLHS